MAMEAEEEGSSKTTIANLRRYKYSTPEPKYGSTGNERSDALIAYKVWIQCLVLAMAMLLLVVAAIAIAMYIVFHPRMPTVAIANATIADFSLAFDNLNGTFVASSMRITLNLANSDLGKTLHYSSATLYARYRGVGLGDSTTPEFTQVPGSNRSFPVDLGHDTAKIPLSLLPNVTRDFSKLIVPVTLTGRISVEFRASRAVRHYDSRVPIDCFLCIRPSSGEGRVPHLLTKGCLGDAKNRKVLVPKC